MTQILQPKNLDEARSLLKTSPKPRIIQTRDDTFNRSLLEHGNFESLLLQLHKRKQDRPKQLDSGINHVLANIAAKNSISFAIDLSSLRPLQAKEKSLSLARLSHLIAICRKSSVPINLLNARDPRGASALLSILGASSQQASQNTDKLKT